MRTPEESGDNELKVGYDFRPVLRSWSGVFRGKVECKNPNLVQSSSSLLLSPERRTFPTAENRPSLVRPADLGPKGRVWTPGLPFCRLSFNFGSRRTNEERLTGISSYDLKTRKVLVRLNGTETNILLQ